jgi:hypothetical protein
MIDSLPPVSVFSCYMQNIPDVILSAQKECVTKFLPEGWSFKQHFTSKRHPDALSFLVEEAETDIMIVLDIDCVPLTPGALQYISWPAQRGALAGCVQRANHIKNCAHLYVGPFCMAFSKTRYKELGSPSFNETARGDVGEELTYAWQRDNPTMIKFLWPSNVEQPIFEWTLDGSYTFGLGTTYDGLFYHAFNARTPEGSKRFIAKCDEILDKQSTIA